MLHSVSSQVESAVASSDHPSNSRLVSLSTAYKAASDPASLAVIWAKKYVSAIAASDQLTSVSSPEAGVEQDSSEGRSRTAQQLLKQLTLASASAWSQTEALLSAQLVRHQIDSALVDPWKIAADSHALFQTALQAYAEQVTPQRLSVLVSGELGRVRKYYTATDPRVIGFVSMQFHYTGRKLLSSLSPQERSLLEPYLKVMDDHLYMPLRDAYEAAANHVAGSPELTAVQQLLPVSTTIAHAVCQQICRVHSDYRSHSGSLASAVVRTSSIRDVEMFQVYLCLCVLEASVRSVQQELFPLCVMLYPPLQVNWRLVQDMLTTLAWEMHDRLQPNDMATFLPYVQTLTDMFSPEVFEGIS